MKRVILSLMILALSASVIGTVSAALEKEMSIQVQETQLRSLPAYYGAVVATVRYGDRVRILEAKGAWVRAANAANNATGWLHSSALTAKRLAARSGSKAAPTSVSAGELSAAEKGFTEQVEKEYRQKHGAIDFTWVDNMEKIKITPKQSAAFLKEGQVRPVEGGVQ